jgi:hypothetical protein
MNEDSDTAAISYGELKRFAQAFVSRYFPKIDMPQEDHPLVALEALEKKGQKAAMKALRELVTDCVEMSLRLPIAEVRLFDSELASLGIVGLSDVRRQYSSRYKKIIERERIKTEEEYRLMRAIADNVDMEIPASERDFINALLSGYEERSG